MKGMIHLYCGDGKGKTTAAAGLALRALGCGRKVLFAQFLKNGDSAELAPLRLVGAQTMICPVSHGFIWTMTEEEKERAAADYTALLREAFRTAEEGFDLLVLDEAVGAAGCGMIPEEELLRLLEARPEALEVVLTGRGPSEALLSAADYVTEMKKLRHPFDRGVGARKGIEY